MKTYTEKELRELDGWIEINVFKNSVIEQQSARRFKVRYRITPTFKGCGCDGFKTLKDAEEYLWYQIEHPSTDPAAAMQVLEKCAEHCYTEGQMVCIRPNGLGWLIVARDSYDHEHASAQTLPLAISLFSKSLFSKQSCQEKH